MNELMEQHTPIDNHGVSGRAKKKVRIRYKERVRIAKRPFGFHVKRFLRKKYAYVIIAALLVVSLGAVVVWANKGTAEKRKAEREYLQGKRIEGYEKQYEKKKKLK
jgi:hypothetical protein